MVIKIGTFHDRKMPRNVHVPRSSASRVSRRFNRDQDGAPRRRRGTFSPRGVSPWEQYRLIVSIFLKNLADPAEITLCLAPAFLLYLLSMVFLPCSFNGGHLCVLTPRSRNSADQQAGSLCSNVELSLCSNLER